MTTSASSITAANMPGPISRTKACRATNGKCCCAKLRYGPTRPGTGEPSAAEVLTAVSEWLASDIKPLVAGRGKFDLAVARNALGIVVRELEQRPMASDAALSADLLAGTVDLATPGLLAQLRRMALDKLTSDMPKYPALVAARAQWEGN